MLLLQLLSLAVVVIIACLGSLPLAVVVAIACVKVLLLLSLPAAVAVVAAVLSVLVLAAESAMLVLAAVLPVVIVAAFVGVAFVCVVKSYCSRTRIERGKCSSGRALFGSAVNREKSPPQDSHHWVGAVGTLEDTNMRFDGFRFRCSSMVSFRISQTFR